MTDQPDRAGRPSEFDLLDDDPDTPLSPQTQKRFLRVLLANAHNNAGQIHELHSGLQDLRRDVPKMMAEGIRTAVGDPATWEAARNAMRSQAKDAAGGLVMGVLGWAATRVFWGVVILGGIYYAGGIPALLAFIKVRLFT